MDSLNIIPIEFATPEYDEMVRLRTKILRVPLGLEFYADDLAQEYDYHHLVTYNSQLQLVACLVLKPLDKNTVQMKQVAVEASVQGNGIGTELVKASEVFAKEKGFTEMVLHARDVAIPFYNKLNYQKVGKPFEEVGIKHFKMKKTL